MTDRHADAIAAASKGQHPAQIADEVRPIVADIIDELDRWLTTFADGLQHTPSGRQALPRGMGSSAGGSRSPPSIVEESEWRQASAPGQQDGSGGLGEEAGSLPP